MFYAALIVTLITILCSLDELNLGQFGLMAPLASATLVGLFLGDLNTGLILGAQLQMIFLGMVGVGASVPPDMVIGTTIATALAILSGEGIELAFVIALPVAMAGQMINILIRTAATALIHWADTAARAGNYKKMSRIHMLGIPLYSLRGLVVFPAVFFGSSVIESALEVIPEFVTNGLEFAGGLLPAVGFGMLLTMMSAKHLLPFYFIGFALATFAGVSLMGVAIFAICFALVMDYICFGRKDGGDKGPQKPDDLDSLME